MDSDGYSMTGDALMALGRWSARFGRRVRDDAKRIARERNAGLVTLDIVEMAVQEACHKVAAEFVDRTVDCHDEREDKQVA